MKAIEQYFHVVLFIRLYKVVLTSISLAKSYQNESSLCSEYIFLLVAQSVSKSYLAMTEPTYV